MSISALEITKGKQEGRPCGGQKGAITNEYQLYHNGSVELMGSAQPKLIKDSQYTDSYNQSSNNNQVTVQGTEGPDRSEAELFLTLLDETAE